MIKQMLIFFVIIGMFFVAGCSQDTTDEGVGDISEQTTAEEQSDDASMEVDLMKELEITSDAFKNNELIPKTYTCDGENMSPSIKIENLPFNAVSIALIMDDPDAPSGTWVHWVAWNIPVTNEIPLNGIPQGTKQGLNDFGNHNYGGPCPPSGEHRYFFKVYALDASLDIDEDSKKADLEEAMEGHILTKGELIGLYEKE
jgi:Raf kinase inhibitor-like YbhB/YbcL family protein